MIKHDEITSNYMIYLEDEGVWGENAVVKANADRG
jgi:hypothetical protein